MLIGGICFDICAMGNVVISGEQCFSWAFPPCLQISITTGDTANPGHHNSVNIQLTDEFGRESDVIKLEGCCLTVFKKGHTDTFKIKSLQLPLNFGKVQKVRLIRNEVRQNVVEWYVDRVEISSQNIPGVSTHRLVFPCNRWLRNDKEVVLTAYDSLLPQFDDEFAQRDNELFSKRAKFRYCQAISGLPPRLKKFPKELVFSNNFKLDISLRKDKLLARLNVTYPEKKAWTDFNDFNSVFDKLGEPMSKNFWMDDVYFGRQRVAGCNPTVIQLCKDIPAGFGVTANLVDPFLEGLTLREALEKSKIFIVDYSILDKADIECENPITSPYGLFFVNKNKDLVPIAIQIYSRRTKDANPVFVPSDPIYTWTLAKMWFNNADAGFHRACAHFGPSYFLLESISIAMHRQLSPSHPIYRLLASYIQHIIPINWFETSQLISYDGYLDNCTNLGVSGLISVLQEYWQTWRLDIQGYLPHDLANRGVLDRDILPFYPYRDDALLIHNAIEDHVTRIVFQNYDDVATLWEDQEIQNWANELTEEDPQLGCNIQGVPGRGRFETFDELIITLTSIIFLCTAGRAACNLPEYDEYGFAPNYPSLLIGKPPTNKRWRDKHSILEHLPTKDVCMSSIVMAKLLTDRKSNDIGNFNMKYQFHPIAVDSRELFMKDLKEAAFTVMERNLLRKYPYDYLNPCSSKN